MRAYTGTGNRKKSNYKKTLNQSQNAYTVVAYFYLQQSSAGREVVSFFLSVNVEKDGKTAQMKFIWAVLPSFSNEHGTPCEV